MSVETTDRGLAYERLGSGEPLLLIHGTGSSMAAWKPVVPLLTTHFELVMVDLPGHGASDLVEGASTPIDYAPLLAELLDEVGHERAHVAGNSSGGWAALELAKGDRARSVTGFC